MIVSKDRILLNDYQHSAFPSGADRHEYQPTDQSKDIWVHREQGDE